MARMAKEKFRIRLASLITSGVWREATSQELRVLTYAIGTGGVPTANEVAEACEISLARAKAAIALWKEAGVFVVEGEEGSREYLDEPTVTLEFDDDKIATEPIEAPSIEVARDIRDEELAELISDIAVIIGKPALNTQEIKHVTSIYTQLAVPNEYIITLAAHMAETTKLTALRLARKANTLIERGIDNIELLEKYISDCISLSGVEGEMRKLFGIYGRELSDAEKKYITRWCIEYGYSAVIVGEAYNIASVNNSIPGKIPYQYMNKLLTSWYEAGCRTVVQVRAQIARDKELLAAAKGGAATTKGRKKQSTAEIPAYSEFNAEDALMLALKRSYGNGGEGENS